MIFKGGLALAEVKIEGERIKHYILGIASILTAIIVFAGITTTDIFLLIHEPVTHPTYLKAIDVFFFMLTFVGACLGISGLIKKDSKNWPSLVGIIANIILALLLFPDVIS